MFKTLTLWRYAYRDWINKIERRFNDEFPFQNHYPELQETTREEMPVWKFSPKATEALHRLSDQETERETTYERLKRLQENIERTSFQKADELAQEIFSGKKAQKKKQKVARKRTR